MRVVVIGGGIVGVATARALALSAPTTQVTLLEREPSLARHQTGRNSGVVHAGIYYPAGSLKAELCRRGAQLLATYAAERGLPYEACGKVVVALDERELPRLMALQERAEAARVPGLRALSSAELPKLEPHAAGIAALHSPSTAITDFAQITHRLAADLTAAGGEVRVGAEARRVTTGTTGATVYLHTGEHLQADRVVVCAGLQSSLLAAASGAPRAPRIVPFRGEYLALRPDVAPRVRGLIYPVPDPTLPFLGVHLTRRVDGSVLIGPNAVPAGGLGAYAAGEGTLREAAALLAWPGAVRLARRHWRAGVAELWRARRTERFVADAARYLPGLSVDDVVAAPAGLRAQAVDADGSLVDDFRVERSGPVAWVRNAPSPAATSSLALAEEILSRAGLAG